MSGPDLSRLAAGLSQGWRQVTERLLAAANLPAADPKRLDAARHLLPIGVRNVRQLVVAAGGDDATAAALIAAPSVETFARWAGADDVVAGARPSKESVAAAVADAPLDAIERVSLIAGVQLDLERLYAGDAQTALLWWVTPRADMWWPGGDAPVDVVLAEGIGALRRARALAALAVALSQDGALPPSDCAPDAIR